MKGDQAEILYGLQRLSLQLPGQSTILNLAEINRRINPQQFRRRLENMLDRYPLDLSWPILVLADKTRLCGYPEYLPLLIEILENRGMRRDALQVIIAYGTHPAQSDKECLQAYGEIFHQLQFVHHDCENADFEENGITNRGTPIRVRRDLLEASCVITMGAICHHYFAGYGGGRKLIFPGCGERHAIYANHSLYLDQKEQQLTPSCQPGILENNPLAEDLFEVEDGGRTPDLAIHGILDSHGQLCDLLVGRGREDFLSACRQHGENCESQAGPFDYVIASCGGYPKDINFIQSHKAIHNAAMFVRDGGMLLLYCHCPDGIGSTTFLPWFRESDFQAAFTRLAAGYEGNCGTALATMTKLQRIRIGLVSDLDDEFFQLTRFENMSHEAVQNMLNRISPEKSVTFIPNASLLVKKQ